MNGNNNEEIIRAALKRFKCEESLHAMVASLTQWYPPAGEKGNPLSELIIGHTWEDDRGGENKMNRKKQPPSIPKK